MVAEGGVSDFRDIIEDMNITKYGYDLKAQRNLLERNGIIMEGKYMDIELMHYLVNPEKSHKIEILAKTYLDINLEESIPQQESAPLSLFDEPQEEEKRGRFPEAAATAMLGGKIWDEMGELGLQELSTYGLMKTTGRSEIRAMADHLEVLGYLHTEPEHQTLRLTPEAAQVLYHGQTVQMLARREEKVPARAAGDTKLTAEEMDLYDALRQLRGELARDANVPAYVVFSNATLQDMARKKPQNTTQFKRVSGVGELKATWYGKAFLEKIREYLAAR